MNLKRIASFAIVSCVAGTLILRTSADDKDHQHKAPSENAALSRFAQLAGEWTGKGMHGDMEHESRVVYKVTAGGSAIVETIDPGTDHEMITVIHPDGDSLVLTHYCMLGNQPQMRAKPKAGDDKVAFEFLKATNLKSDKDMYMHDVTFTFVDRDNLKSEWTNYNDGKPAGKVVIQLKRKK